MTENEIIQKFSAWCLSEFSLTLIKANQPFPPPRKPYATIKVVTEIPLGQFDEQRDIDANGDADFVGFRDATLSIQFFDDVNSGSGKTAFQQAQEAIRSLNKKSVIDNFFFTEGIAIRRKSPINNVETFLDTINEQRAQFDLLIGYVDEYQDEVGYIERVQATDNILDEPNELIIDVS